MSDQDLENDYYLIRRKRMNLQKKNLIQTNISRMMNFNIDKKEKGMAEKFLQIREKANIIK